jgi:amino acid adenylation domain-containing protein
LTTDSSLDDDDRRALFELLLAEEGVAPTGDNAAIARRSDGAPRVLSFAQERLWFLHQFDDDTSALNIRVALRLHGRLDVTALAGAVDDVVARHATLRTRYLLVDGRPEPRPVEPLHVPWSFDDVALDESPDEKLATILREEGAREFDLERDAPLHVRLMRFSDDEHVLSLVVHHIAADGWSMHVLVRDLAALYGERIGVAPAELPELAIDYEDYAAWQRRFVSGDRYACQLEHWRTTLARPLPTAELPPDFARPRRHTFTGGQVTQSITRDDAEALRRLARRNSATPFMVLLTALNVLIGRRADLDDVIVGTPVAGRVRPEVEPLVGAFLNMLPLRVDLAGDPTFEQLLGRVRDVCLDAFDNQDIAFEQLLAELSPDRDISRTPLFQVLFNMMTVDDRNARDTFPGLEFELVGQADLSSKFDLTVYVDDQGEGPFSILLVYNRALYRPDTMRQLLEQFVMLLGEAAAHPARPISTYSLVTPEAESSLPLPSRVLDDTWHGTVVDAVHRHAMATPERPAIESANEVVTYGALAARIAAVRSWLVANTVGSGQIVAVHGHRSPALVWTVLGVLASGAAYLILDPSYPPARLARYLRLAKPSAWLTVPGSGEVPSELLDVLDEFGVDVRADVGDLPSMTDSPLGVGERQIGPDDVACLTFTSGSTGTPKAVVGLHGSLTHFLPWQSRRFGVTAADRFTMLSGLAHDPLQRDMFWPAWLGATLVVPDPEQIPTPGWLASWMADRGVTVTHLTPAMGRLITDHAGTTRLPGLRHALFIGDVLTRDDVLRLRDVAPAVTVTNLYGTTETQRASGFHVVGDEDLFPTDATAPPDVLPIGWGMESTQLLVRRADGQPVGFGEIGEIWMRSPHLAAGYLDQPAATDERFIRLDPADRARVYRTGDRGRYRCDGAVEFRGRTDGQVQLRGFRIETAEVRGQILCHPAVRDAVVVVRDEPHPRLVGYVVPADHRAPPDIDALRARLRSTLPSQMVPSDIVVLDRIPLSPSGKIDRTALPEPTRGRRDEDDAPRNSIEERLAGWFATVLQRSDVGIHDNFFDLGGYSLLATQLFAVIEAETGRRIPVATLFEAPTVASLADVIRQGVAPSTWTSVVPIQPLGTQLPFFYVAPYMISVLEFVRLGQELGHDQPLYGIQPQGLDGRSPIHTTIEEMAAHYVNEIKSVQPLGPYRIGGHCSGSWVAFEIARQLEAAGDELDTVVLVDQGPPGVARVLPSRSRYLWMRLSFYYRDDRLLSAIRWQLKIRAKRRFLRRIAPRTIRNEERVRAAHRAAYLMYTGGVVHHSLALIRSDESVALEDKSWYLEWHTKTTGQLRLAHTPGTHANLLKRGFVEQLADRLRWAFDPSLPSAID